MKGGAEDKKGKGKPAADKANKKKDDTGGSAAGSDLIDTFDACHTYVHLSLELAKPLLPTPPPLPLSDLVPRLSHHPPPLPRLPASRTYFQPTCPSCTPPTLRRTAERSANRSDGW